MMSRRATWALVSLAVLPVACWRGAVEEPPPPGDILQTAVPLYSDLFEEVIIRDFFQDRRGGVFVDVGCYTPIARSNTYYLERHLGWSGVAVDALAEYAPAWAEARPNSKFFAYAVTDQSDTTATFFRTRQRALSSLDEVARLWDPDAEAVEVQTISLNRLLADNGIERVDFLSMDITGSEPDALRGFDIARFRPELVCISAHFGLSPKAQTRFNAGLLEYFAEHGYARLEKYLQYDVSNWYFAPRDAAEDAG